MPSRAAVRDGLLEMGSYVLIEAGPEPSLSPARRGAFSLRMGRMKTLILAGIVVAALGVVVLTLGVSYPGHRSMMRVGDLQASVQEQHTIPTWVGIAAIAGGALIIGSGLRRRKA
jgi:drug/metabolite transporter (DMT)-like permease